MTSNLYVEWVRSGLAQKGFSQKGLAKALNVDASAISKLVAGKRLLKAHEIKIAAEYFGTPPPELEVQLSDSRLVAAAVAGPVEAGAFREVDDMDQSEPEVLMLPQDDKYPNARLFVVDVFGDSMDRLSPRPILPGDRVACLAIEDIESQLSLRDGMTVLLERTRDGGHTREWSIKQLELYEGRTEYHPRSNNPKHKPIVVMQDAQADDGVKVEIIGIVRRVVNEIPL